MDEETKERVLSIFDKPIVELTVRDFFFLMKVSDENDDALLELV